jgi:hypothetical protein
MGLLGILGGVEQQRGVFYWKLPIVLENLVMGKQKMHITEEKNLNFGAITQQINTNNKFPQFLVDDLVSFRWKREPTISL